MAASDRDIRAKLSMSGPASLSDAELLSIILGEGSDGRSAIEMATQALDTAGGSLSQLASQDMTRLRMAGGLGVKRAAILCSSFELGRRVAGSNNSEITAITCNEDVLAIFSPMLETLPHEEFWVLYLSSANRILHKVKVSQGGVSGTAVDYKLIVKRAVELLAAAFIVVHNHPSGVCTPSKSDIEMTDKLRRGAELFEITLLDHVIISKGDNFSFRYNLLLE